MNKIKKIEPNNKSNNNKPILFKTYLINKFGIKLTL